MKKKGISPLIATVLLVGFTVALVVLIILWGRSYTEEQAAKQGALSKAKLKCQQIGFSIPTQPSSSGLTLKNIKSVQIDDFIFRELSSSGSAKLINPKTTPVVLSGNGQTTVTFSTTPKKVEIIPRILAGGSTYVPCSAQSKKVNFK